MNLRGVALKTITIALFVLPVLFFASIYFLQVVSSEDIHQGAGQPVSIAQDASDAFQWSARFGDMYAWSVVNFFDYKYEFGIDTVFRLFDAALAVGIFFLMTTLILGRRPKWELKDALIFGTSFLVVFLSDYSRSIVSGFSHIHNYVFIVLFSLLFLLPFVRQIRGKTFPSSIRNKLLMLVLGFLFAFSSNIPPVTFLITAALVIAYDKLVSKQKWSLDKTLNSWQIFAVAGMLIAMAVMYVFGPGVSSYTHGYNSSYVSIQSLIESPLASGTALIGNMAHNFRLIAPALVVVALVALFEYVIYRKRLISKRDEPVAGVRFSVICLVFFFVHILAVSQIDIDASNMTRLLLSAYVCATVSVLFTVNRAFQIVEIKNGVLGVAAIPVLLLVGVITVDVSVGMIRHQQQAAVVLERIKNSADESVCVTLADNPTAKSPILKYYQREMFTEWIMPATIYGKHVNLCS